MKFLDVENQEVLKIIDEDEVDSFIRNIINISLYNEVKCLIIETHLYFTRCSRDRFFYYCNKTNKFLTILKSGEFGFYNKYFQERFDDSIMPTHILSNMLETYVGERLTNDKYEIARDWVNDIDKIFLLLIPKFSIKASPFLETHFFDVIILNNLLRAE